MNDLSIVILTKIKFPTQFEWVGFQMFHGVVDFQKKMRKNEILKLMFCVEANKVLRTWFARQRPTANIFL